MALSDRDIIIAPSRGASGDPITTYRGGDASTSATITLRVLNSGTSASMSFEGATGQILSLNDQIVGTVFSANDVSGVPSIEVLDTGQVKIAEYNGFLTVGGAFNNENATSTSTGELRVIGGMSVWRDLFVGGTITAAQFSGTSNVATTVGITDASSTAGTHYLTFVTGTSGNLGLRADSGLQFIPSTNRLGIGVAPSYSLDVAAQSSPFQTVARFGNGGQDILITHANAIISHNASYNGGWTRTGTGYAGQIDFQGGKFEFSTSPTTAGAGTAITDWNSRFIILNNGNIGIGDSSPSQKLVVSGAAVITSGVYGAETGAPDATIWAISGDYTNWGLFYNEGDPDFIEYKSAGTVTSRIALDTGAAHFGLSGGFAGIGTSSPSTKLHLYESGAANVILTMTPANSSYDAIINMTGQDGNISTEGFQIQYRNNVGDAILKQTWTGITGTTPAIRFSTANTTDAAVITGNGNVGVGTTGPINKFQVVGGNTTIGVSDGASTNRGRFFWQTTTNYVGIGLFNDDNSNLMFGTTAAERMRITAAGNVGINTISPGRTFDVDGVANFRSHIAQTIDHSRPNVQWGAGGTSTGAIIIKFPGNSGNYGMVHVVIDIYTYDSEGASTVIVGGHNWNSQWYAISGAKLGNYSKGVRVGFKDGQYCIVLGTNSSTWSYGQVRVRKIQNGSYYSGIMDLSGTYSIVQDSAAESYTYISSNLLSSAGAGGWNSGNDGSGSGLDADLLDGLDSTQFLRDDALNTGFLAVDGQTANNAYDSVIYATATNNNDWLLRLNARNGGKTEYGGYVDIPNSATYAWGVLTDGSGWNWRINGSGHSFSPIYYDVNDTGRYMDMNGNNLSQIGTLRLNSDWGGSGVHLEQLTVRGSYPSLCLRSTASTQQYWLLHNDNGTSLLFYGGRGATDGTSWDWAFRMFGNADGLYAEGRNSLRAPIFYDSNDTGYYADPASTSRFNGLQLDGTLGFRRGSGDYNTYIRSNGYPAQGYANSDGTKYWVELGAMGGVHVVLNTDGGSGSAENSYDHFTIWQGSNSGDRVFWVTNTGRTTIGTTVGGTVFAQLNLSQGFGAQTWRDIDIKGNWNAGEGHAISATHGSSSSNLVGQMVFQHDSPGSRIRWGRLYHSGDVGTYPMQLISNDGSGNARLEMSAGSDMRAPIFYDVNDTNFFADPAGTSRFNILTVNGLNITNGRISTSQTAPTGHWGEGHEVFTLDPSWTDAQLRAYFNSNNVSWVADSTAPGGYAIQISGGVNVGGVYGSGFPYIAVDSDDIFYMECWIRDISGSNGHYMGSIDFDHNFSSLGGNPGSFGYWTMSNSFPGTSWTRYTGYITGFGQSTGQFEPGTKYWTPQALFNYSGGGTSYISGWKVIKINRNGPLVVNLPAASQVMGTSNSLAQTLTVKKTGQGQINFGAYPGAWSPAIQLQNNDNTRMVWIGSLDSGNRPRIRTGAAGLDIYTNGTTTDGGTYSAQFESGSVRSQIFYDLNDTNWYVDPNADLAVRVYGEIANSNYQQGAMQPGALNIGRTDTNYGWDGTSWASDIRSGILANCSELWEFNIHDSGDSVMSAFRYNGTNQLLMGRDIGWGTCYVEAAQDFRAPIFYDSNNTEFLMDPAGTSKMQYIDSLNYADFREANQAVNDWEASGLVNNPTVNGYADGSWYITSNSYDWSRGILSKRRFRRVEGLTLEFEAYSESAYVGNVWWMMGFVSGTSGSYSYCQGPANLLYQSAGGTTAYDNCSYMGTNYNVNTYNTWTKFRVVLRSGGAEYWVHWNGAWQLIVATGNNDASNNEYVRVLCTLYSGRVYFRNVSVFHQSGYYRGDHYYHNVNMRSLGVGTAPSGTQGEIRATNEITAYYSDRRLKTDLVPIENAVEKIKQLHGVTYRANELAKQFGYDVNKRQAGLLADEVEAVLPEVIRPAPFDIDQDGNSKSGENYKTVQYEKLIPLLVEAIKEQQSTIEELTTEIKELKGKLGNNNG